MRKAFTLIELLVVIAIIAILAAILFPVFAQAKAAAKGAASISNVKQHVLAAIMYASDNEDYLPLAIAWNTGSDTITFGAGRNIAPWGWSVQPYMKSDGLFRDPLATPNTLPTGFSRIVYDTLIPHYGYNYTFMSPYITDPAAPANLLATSTSTTTPASPTATVMMTSKFTAQEEGSGCCWLWANGSPFVGGWVTEVTIDGPNCGEIPEFCSGNWGTGNGFWDAASTAGANIRTNEAGRRTGGMSSRATSKAVVGWVDGHANKNAPTGMGAGTNYSNTRTAATLVFTTRANYLWDLQ